MANKGFGSELWKNMRSVKLAKDGRLEAPVRANGRDGIVVGLDRVATSPSSSSEVTADQPPSGRLARWWGRLTRR